MKAIVSSAIRYLVLLIIGIALLILAFRGQDLNKLLIDLQKADYRWVTASVIACFLAHGIRTYRWRMMIGSLGHGSPSFRNTFYAVLIGYLANLAFPRMGEVSRCGVINKTDGIPLVKLIGTVIAERLVDLLMLCIIIALAIFLQFRLLSEFLYKHVLLKLSFRLGDPAILVIVSGLLAMGLLFFIILIKKKNWGLSTRIYNLFNDMKSGILSVKGMENKSAFVLSSVLIWVFYGLSTYLCFFALSATSGLGIMEALSALVFGSLGMVAPVQGGIGAFHWMVSEGLTIYGIEKSDGLAYALLIHSSQTLIILFTGALSLILLIISSPKKNRYEQAG